MSNTTAQGPEVTGQTDLRREPLTLEGKRYIVRDPTSALIHLALALGAARTLGWYNAWLHAAVVLLVKVSSTLILARVNPAVLNARGTKQAMSARERVFFSVFAPSWLAIPIVAGLDAGGAGWTHYSVLALAGGLALVLLGTSLVGWAIAVNAFFEKTVRIQHDREQRVCTSGPYRFVRHPGYTAAIMAVAGVPLALGSFWSFVPVIVMTVALIVRTAYEDRLLRAELDGYEAYAARTRYRLCPFVW